MAFANFSLATTYTAIITALNTQLTAAAALFKDQTTGDFTGQIRVSGSGKRLESWNGAAWVALDLSSTAIAAASIASGTITANLTGNVSGNVTGSSGSCTGNAATATSLTGAISASALAQVYPVGSIYLSTVSTNPATLFGFGTWARTGEGRALIDCGSTYGAGSTGGAATHTLTTDEIPSHSHYIASYDQYGSGASVPATVDAAGGPNTQTTNAVGGNYPHNNMPPYLAVYIWKRTA